MVAANDAAGMFPGVAKNVEAIQQALGEFRKSGITVNVGWFSEYVVAGDWSPAWQAAHDLCEGLAGGGALTFPPGFSGQFKSQVTWNPNKVGVKGNGATLDFSAFSGAAYACKLRQSINDANLRSAASRTHAWEDSIIIGTASAVGTVTWFEQVDHNTISGQSWAAGITFDDCAFVNWWRDFGIGAGGFFLLCRNCAFAITQGGPGDYSESIFVPSSVNSGENLRFEGCFFGKVYGALFNVQNPDAAVFCYGCSADYTQRLFLISGGSFYWHGYIENNSDAGHWVEVSGENTLCVIEGETRVTGNKAAFEIFYVDQSATQGGLVAALNLQFAGGVTYPMKLIKGSGRASVKLLGHSKSTVHPAIGGSTNVFSNPSFENLTYGLSEWVLSGATSPVINGGQHRTGNYAMKLQAASGVTPRAQRDEPCKQGEYACGELYFMTEVFSGTGATLIVNVDYLDAGGNVLAAANMANPNTTVGAWTRVTLSTQTPAPQGTRNARVWIQVSGTTTGAPVAWVDDVDFCVVQVQ